jgi:hypothetical protein
MIGRIEANNLPSRHDDGMIQTENGPLYQAVSGKTNQLSDDVTSLAQGFV